MSGSTSRRRASTTRSTRCCERTSEHEGCDVALSWGGCGGRYCGEVDSVVRSIVRAFKGSTRRDVVYVRQPLRLLCSKNR